ncbi:FHA domain protein [Roseimaritima multifibrata]|uniref:FHA domain protein n=1 Tax=Roseimaritima multifibrata TaxID=1930274 RepID=A0A517ME22_9BACT|nr:FHA domain-containing protein [Roseimaritima multifibrata]QDS93133.1 FHA domain protein [Roseimaritima multifibrata]
MPNPADSSDSADSHATHSGEDMGDLVPCGGGDPIPLFKSKLVIGRRESCDISLKFSNVSGQHCRLALEAGYWFVRDLNSRNGTKVDGKKIYRKRLDPGCRLSIAKHDYTVEYDPQRLGAFGTPPPDDDDAEEMLRRSLMERAGLTRRSEQKPNTNRNVLDD